MIADLLKMIKEHEFSEGFLHWAATLAFLPIAFYLRFVIGTSLILDKSFPDYRGMVIFLGIIISGWLGWKWLKNKRIDLTGLEPYLGGFIVAAGLSVVFSENPGLSLEKYIGIFAYLLFAYLLLDIKGNGYLWQGIINGLLITSIFSSLAILVSIFPFLEAYQIGLGELLTDPLYVYRALPRVPYSLLFHPSVTAGYLVLIMPLGFYQLGKSRKLSWKILLGLGIIINLSVLVLTRSRGGLLGLVFMIAGAVYIYRGKLLSLYERNRPLLIAVGALLGILSIVFIFLLASTRGFSLAGRSIQARIQLWKAALMILRDNLLFGSGPGTFGQVYFSYRDPVFEGRTFIHAHNQILQIAAEFGLLGLLSLMAVSWKLFKSIKGKGVALSSHQRLGMIALSGLFGVLIPDAIFTSSMIVFLLIFYLVWIFPEEEFRLPGNPNFLYVVTVLAILIGIGASWICWKIAPYYKAVDQEHSRNWEVASKQLIKAIERDPNNPYYQYALGYTLGEEACAQGEGYSVPITHYERAMESYPGWDIGLANLAGLHSADGNFGQASERMEDAIQSYPYQPFYNCLLGDYYWELGRADDALTAYSDCIVDSPNILSTSYWGESEHRTSIQLQVIQQARTELSGPDVDRVMKSKLLYYSGETTEALSIIRDFLDDEPFDLSGNLFYFSILDNTGRVSEDEGQLAELLRLNPANYYLWLILGRNDLLSDAPMAAEKDFKISYLRQPSMANVLALGNLYHERGDFDLAQYYFQQALYMSALNSTDFSRLVAGRWPLLGVYNSCLPGFYSYMDYIFPALETADDLRIDNCNMSACLLHQLANLNPPLLDAQTQLRELPCYQEFDPAQCFPGKE